MIVVSGKNGAGRPVDADGARDSARVSGGGAFSELKPKIVFV